MTDAVMVGWISLYDLNWIEDRIEMKQQRTDRLFGGLIGHGDFVMDTVNDVGFGEGHLPYFNLGV